MKSSKKKTALPTNSDLDTVVDLEELEFAARENVNVIFTGRKGVGKTQIALSILKKAGKKVKYLSASTIDPFVHFVGIPKKSDTNDFFSMALPDWFEEGYDCLFIDEIGRARTSVTNALFELCQFGTMHGKDLGIKLIWAANNPHDDLSERYDVQPLDPALLDRFIIRIDVPYKCDQKYFYEKYGNLGLAAVSYWENNLDENQKLDLSPRRLDNAVYHFKKGFDLKNIVPNKGSGAVNSSELTFVLEQSLPVEDILERFVKGKNIGKSTDYIRNENNFSLAKNIILKNDRLIDYFVPLMELENVASIATNNKVARHILRNFTTYPEHVLDVLKNDAELNNLYVKCMNSRAHELVVENYDMFTVDMLPDNLPKINDLTSLLELNSISHLSTADKFSNIAAFVKSNPSSLENSECVNSLWQQFSDLCFNLDLGSLSDTKLMIRLHGVLVNAYSKFNKRPIYIEGILSEDEKVLRHSELMVALAFFCNTDIWTKLNELTAK